MLKLRWRRVAMLLAVCTSSPALAAGFDCTKATMPIEKAICEHPDLSLADFVLNERYRYLVAKCGMQPAEQRAWMADVRMRFAGFGQVERAVAELRLRYQRHNEELREALDQCSLKRQPAPLRIVTASAPHGPIKLPWVTDASPEVARRINDAVFTRFLDQASPARLADAIAVLAGDDRQPGGTREAAFTVRRNDGRLLVIEFDVEGCGSYCTSYSTQMLFDARTGQRLMTPQLFTAEGLSALKRQFKGDRVARGRALLAQAEEEGNAEPDELDYYRGCVQDWNADDKLTPSLELSADGNWQLRGDRCSIQAVRTWYQLDGIRVPLPRELLSRHLSSYGKSILLGEEGP